MPILTRRHFLAAGSLAAGSLLLPRPLIAAPKPHGDFRFLFITDTHIQPELNGIVGTKMALAKAKTIAGSEFAIHGGDMVFDSERVPKERSLSLFELYDQAQQTLGFEVHHTIGNHDVFGLEKQSGVEASDPLFAKAYFKDHYGPTNYSFDHKGVHFVVLDVVHVTEDRLYEGYVPQEQRDWLDADLKKIPPGTPVIVITHMPLITASRAFFAPFTGGKSKYETYSVGNAFEVLAILEQHNVIGVLQGHTHIFETVVWRGIPYVTSGAVCGNWWQGPMHGVPEGFLVVDVKNGKMEYHYETYGFKAVNVVPN